MSCRCLLPDGTVLETDTLPREIVVPQFPPARYIVDLAGFAIREPLSAIVYRLSAVTQWDAAGQPVEATYE